MAPPQEVQAVGGSLRIPNDTDSPILISHNDHICQVNAIVPADNVVRPQTNHQFDHLFQPEISRYNGASGDKYGSRSAAPEEGPLAAVQPWKIGHFAGQF